MLDEVEDPILFIQHHNVQLFDPIEAANIIIHFLLIVQVCITSQGMDVLTSYPLFLCSTFR